ncbi:TonB-dependent receptor [Acidicapsa acidisoli]|uniref:TonB-dependent receptor n=1 Tax=Acidicapsa acidisoli TaxID=1615681 RepID=UPI0021E0B9DE|nr:TonB-dependent receptor [Acidicapsa acidisoli]
MKLSGFRSFRSSPGIATMLLALLSALPISAGAQTFRGAINGTVTDPSGAVVAGATVEAVETATNASHKSITSSAGEFAFPDMPVGSYTVSVTASGFKPEKIDQVPVSAGATYALPVKLGVASAGETVEVTANSLAVDTVTDTQSTTLPETVVQNLPNSGRDFTQMLAQTPGFAGLSTGGGGGYASVNGTRTNSVNWQIEGTDNNDLWWNIPAVNQGGVSAIAGVILPIDAIENFSFVTAGTTDLGRNSGGTANLTIKSGTNGLHGSAYYYNHNEFFQHSNPFTGATTETRNQHYGFSVGGPIVKDRLFFFLAGEHQAFLIGAQAKATEPSAAYQTEAYAILDAYGVPHNAVAANLLNGNGSLPALWPAVALTGSANTDNYTSTGNLTGHSFNGIAKLDYQLSPRDHIAANWFVGQGTQTAPTSSELYYYFENAPIHVQNYSLVENHVFSPSITNQISAGVSYFNQAFSDANTALDPIGLGLNTGVTDPALGGAPHLIIGPTGASSGLTAGGSGFDPLGVTPPEGRNDITGHLDENLSWIKGAHQMHFGGEFRQAQVDDFYQTGERGTIYFDGTQGPWNATGTACANLQTVTPSATTLAALTSDPNAYFLADFLAGCFDPTNSENVVGDPKRQVFVNTFSLSGQDQWEVAKNLSLNFGVRYDYEGPVHSDEPNLSIFDPSLPSGLAVAGKDVANIYPKFWGGVSPRIGFAYQPYRNDRTVIRGGYGLYYDSIYMKSILENNGAQNISVFGPGQNPAGSEQVVQAPGLANTVIQSGTPIFESYADALNGQGVVKISTFDPHFRPAYTQEFDFNIQQSLTPSVIFQLGYVGTKGTHLLGLFDINPALPGSAVQANPNLTRPYYSQFPNFSVIDEARSNLGSIYSSLQSSLRIQNYHHLTAQLAYTWGHALDYETGFLPYVPQDPANEKGEYGNSDFDVRNTVTGYLDYSIPTFGHTNRLVKGWEINSGFSFHGGEPFTVVSASNPSNNGEGADRAVQVIANPTAGVSHSIVNGVVQWFQPNAFVDEPETTTVGPAGPNTYSPTRRGQNYNPGYNSVDVSFIKTTQIKERVSAQFRADVFNIFNRTNYEPVGLPSAGESGAIGSTIGVYLGNPGIGPGEPLNAEFALKILF